MSKAQHPGGKQGPLKATIPISGVVKQSNIHISAAVGGAPASPLLRWNRSRASPEHACSGQRSPGARCYKGKPKQDCGVALETMRRTASLDTVYLTGHWPKDHFHWGHMGTLQLDKATQTENNYWTEARHLHYIADSEVGLVPKIRGRQASTGSDNSSQTSFVACITRSYPVHLSPVKPLPKSSMRSSVEGLNQEIERIVLRTGADPYQNDRSDPRQATPEGHRAPLAEMLQSSRSRSVNTQTPQDFGNSSGSSSGESHSPPMIRKYFRDSGSSSEGDSHGSSPDTEAKLGTSPHINRFLAREPPDGCEKVRLKSLDERADVLLDRAPQPSSFKLRPSLGSAFKMLQPARSSSAENLAPPAPQ